MKAALRRAIARPAIPILAAAVMSACAAAPPQAPDASAIAPQLTGDHFIADDGVALPLRVWQPDGKPKAVILALHGFDDYSNAFTGPGGDWAKDGIATYAYDQRGFGAAPPARGIWPGTARLVLDLNEASHLLRDRYPTLPLFLLGESMGGAVIIVAESGTIDARRPEADGIVLSAPAIWGRASMTVLERTALWLGDRIVPGMTVTGQGLHIMASDNIAMLWALGRDPLVIKATRIDTIKGLVDLMDEAQEAPPRFDKPLLLLYGEKDQVIPNEATQAFIAHLSQADTTVPRRIARYSNGYHLLLRDLDAALVRRDIEAWIADTTAPLPSGADRRAAPGLAANR